MTTVNLKLEWRERRGYRKGAIWLYAGPLLVAHIIGRCQNGCFIGYPLVTCLEESWPAAKMRLRRGVSLRPAWQNFCLSPTNPNRPASAGVAA
jgi:hypothetical protein